LAVFITILSPDPVALSEYQHVVGSMATRILPTGLSHEKHIDVSPGNRLLVGILGRREQLTTHGQNILAGVTLDESEQIPWWQLDGPVPDGSFAMFRGDDHLLEAVTDYAGSKTIWHARLACGGIVASTSMELIVAMLGDFAVDDESLGWFLSSGSSGPSRSWDRRIKPLAPNSRLRARLDGTTVSVREIPLERPDEGSDDVDFAGLKKELTETVSTLRFGSKPWLLALSGGHDSRAILHATRHVDDLTCVTWVDEFLTDRADSDLAIARQLARETGRKHLIKIIKRPEDAPRLEQALRRFVRYNDGRVDNYLAYVDGMQIWDELSVSEFGGLLRGDELFGCSFATRTPQILQNMRLNSFSDYAPGNEQRELARLHNHSTPPALMKQPGESAARWRWRLRADYEIPTVYAALNSIRARFTEVSCPLLTGRLVRLAGRMRSADLDDKYLFNSVVGSLFPNIPFAAKTSILRRSDVLAIPQATELLLEHMGSTYAQEILGEGCASSISNELNKLGDNRSVKFDDSGVAVTRKSSTAAWMKRVKRRFDPPPPLHPPTLGMRSYLAKLVQEEMSESARLGAEARDRIRQTAG
jgi:hypothetical protein